MCWQQIYECSAGWDTAGQVVTLGKTFYNPRNKRPTQVYKEGQDHQKFIEFTPSQYKGSCKNLSVKLSI